jgi:protein-S-isoprenylcysteine O-methyltransferase Ste14
MADIAIWICWGVVVVTWIAGAVYGARKSRRQRQPSGSGGLWRLGSIVAAVLIYRLAFHDLHRLTDHSLWIELSGLAVLVISTCFTIWARLSLGRMWSATPNMLRADHQLRTDGPYAITRHPIYTGLFGMLLGTVLLNGLGASLALIVVGAAVLATRIPIEERLMSKTFPNEYARYRERVPRFVPRLHLPRGSHQARRTHPLR